MHRPPLIVRLIVLLVVVSLVAAGAWYYLNQEAAEASGPLTASGTIEADAVTLSAQVPGRIVEVKVDEGQPVTTGAAMVVLDGATLAAQRQQAQAQVAAANANVAALEQQVTAAAANVAVADAQVALLEAGPTAEQLEIAQATVDAAQVTLDDLQDAYDDLSRSEKDSPPGREVKLRLDNAGVNLRIAQSQQRATQSGARQEEIDAARAQADAARAQQESLAGQVEAARSQAAAAEAGVAAVDAQIAQLTVTSPIDGLVLSRSVDPGEYAAPGGALLVVGSLSTLTLTVYVPEDRLGEVGLGRTAQVGVDSFAGEAFSATVDHIADQAEFTPRNVQTVEGRKSTVFAVRLSLANPDGRLKPGMPADVTF